METFGEGRQVITASAFSATPFGVSAQIAPAAISFLALSLLRSVTVT